MYIAQYVALGFVAGTPRSTWIATGIELDCTHGSDLLPSDRLGGVGIKAITCFEGLHIRRIYSQCLYSIVLLCRLPAPLYRRLVRLAASCVVRTTHSRLCTGVMIRLALTSRWVLSIVAEHT